jgi:hypothetical protein
VQLYCRGYHADATVIFKTPKNRAYDLALLRAEFDDGAHVSNVKIASLPAIKGNIALKFRTIFIKILFNR